MAKKWLKGLGEGMANVGQMLLANSLDTMRAERLAKISQEFQHQENELTRAASASESAASRAQAKELQAGSIQGQKDLQAGSIASNEKIHKDSEAAADKRLGKQLSAEDARQSKNLDVEETRDIRHEQTARTNAELAAATTKYKETQVSPEALMTAGTALMRPGPMGEPAPNAAMGADMVQQVTQGSGFLKQSGAQPTIPSFTGGAPATEPGNYIEQSSAGAPPPAPPPAQRVAGNPYTTPRGVMKWTGAGWLPVQ